MIIKRMPAKGWSAYGGKKILTLFIIIPALFLTGCVIKFNTGTSSDSGFYKTEDKGKKWEQSVELLNTGEGRSFFKNAQATFLRVDPEDPKALYMGSLEKGLFYTFNKAKGWQRTLTGKGVVYDLAIDPKNKCTLYTAVGNRVYKSDDCARNWYDIHLEGLPEQSIRAVAVDHYNNNKVYIGTSGGGIFKSFDFGGSWESIKRFKSSIKKIIINPKNTGKVYVATNSNGIFKSNDEGINWHSISNNIKDKDGKKYKNVDSYRDIEFDYTENDAIIYANKYGLFYSNNGGNAWDYIKLLTPPSSVNIYAVAINPNNNQEIYYATATAFYKTSDGGKEWTTESLPTSKVPIDILVDSDNNNNIFMTVRKIK